MASDTELALIAASAYISTRHLNNRIAWPEKFGWVPITDPALDTRLAAMGFEGSDWHAIADSGFEVVAYKKGNEVVIAFAGTAPWTSSVGDWLANAALALGNYSDQLRDAARYYVALKETQWLAMWMAGYTANTGNTDWIGYVYPNTNGNVPVIQ